MVDDHREEYILENAVLMEIEKLRRVSLASLRAKYREVFAEETRCRHREHLFRRIAWRLQALAEGDLTERARERASQLARDADLRMVAPRGFFMVEGAPVRTARGAGTGEQRMTACPCRERCSAGSGKGEPFWWRFWRTGSGLRAGITRRLATVIK